MKNVEKKPGGKKQTGINWTLKAMILSFGITVVFSLVSELIARSASIYLSALIILILVAFSIITDMIATAIAAVDQAPFVAMSSRKVRGAKEAITLIRHAEKVCSICNDVIGDICGIVSGAGSAAIVFYVVSNVTSGNAESIEMWVSILVSALIACITIGGKAFGKAIAIKRSKDIILLVGVGISFFKKQDRTK